MTHHDLPPRPARVTAWHPASGNTLTGDAVAMRGDSDAGWVSMIPDGLLEQVTLRRPAWVVLIRDT